MKQVILFALLVCAVTGCRATGAGIATDTKANTTAVKGAVETLDVKTAIIADKTIDSGAIDVDTFAEKKLVVIRGSVPTQAQKDLAGQIAAKNATGYKIDNQLAVVPTTKPESKGETPVKPVKPEPPAVSKPTEPATKPVVPTPPPVK